MAFPTAMLPHANSVANFCPALRRPRSRLRIPGVSKCRILCVDIAATAASDTCDSPSSKETQITVSITGATGFIGRRLVKRLTEGNHEVRVLTRSKAKARIIFPVEDFPKITIAQEPEWKRCIEGSYAVVNLAGTPISTRWSYEAKKEIKESRTRVTSTVVELINSANSNLRPSVLVSATAIGYYDLCLVGIHIHLIFLPLVCVLYMYMSKETM